MGDNIELDSENTSTNNNNKQQYNNNHHNNYEKNNTQNQQSKSQNISNEFDFSKANFSKQEVQKEIKENQKNGYNPSKSFWDDISTESVHDRITNNKNNYKNRRRDVETFGTTRRPNRNYQRRTGYRNYRRNRYNYNNYYNNNNTNNPNNENNNNENNDGENNNTT